MAEILALAIAITLCPSQAKAIIPWRDPVKAWLICQRQSKVGYGKQKIVKRVKKTRGR